jgi:hypothetical protein
VALSHSPSLILPGLVLCLDAANSKSYFGSGTTWTDLSGNGNTGTLTNGPTYSSANGGSIVFDGVDDTLPTLLSTNTLNNITQSVWFKWNGTNQSSGIMYLGNSNSNGFGLYIGSSGTPSNLLGVLFGGSLFNALSSSVTLTTNWTNFVITRDSTTTSLYQNGSLFASTTNTPLTSASYPFIGNFNAGGNISNISFYNRALTAAEIQQNFNALRSRFSI